MKRSHEQMTNSDVPMMVDNIVPVRQNIAQNANNLNTSRPNGLDNVVPVRQNIAQNANNLNTSTPNTADDIREFMPGILITFDLKRGFSIRLGPVNPTGSWWTPPNPQPPRQMSAPVTREQPAIPTAEPTIQTIETKVSGTVTDFGIGNPSTNS